MTDKELLELAAKAAGYKISQPNPPDYEWLLVNCGHKNDPVYWNPLTDDGDALRLAVKLNIQPGCVDFENSAYAFWKRGSRSVIEKINEDPYAATRRAIVRAAAEIGKENKE